MLAAHEHLVRAPAVHGGPSGIPYESFTATLHDTITSAVGEAILILPGAIVGAICEFGVLRGTTASMNAWLNSLTGSSGTNSWGGMNPVGVSSASSGPLINFGGGMNFQMTSIGFDAEVAVPYTGSVMVSTLCAGEGGNYIGGTAPLISLQVAGNQHTLGYRADSSIGLSSILPLKRKLMMGGTPSGLQTFHLAGTTLQTGLGNAGSTNVTGTPNQDDWVLGREPFRSPFFHVGSGRPAMLVVPDVGTSFQMNIKMKVTWSVRVDPGLFTPAVPYGMTAGPEKHPLSLVPFTSHSSMGSTEVTTSTTIPDHHLGDMITNHSVIPSVPRQLFSGTGETSSTIDPKLLAHPATALRLAEHAEHLTSGQEAEILITDAAEIAESIYGPIAAHDVAGTLKAIASNSGKIVDGVEKGADLVGRGIKAIRSWL